MLNAMGCGSVCGGFHWNLSHRSPSASHHSGVCAVRPRKLTRLKLQKINSKARWMDHGCEEPLKSSDVDGGDRQLFSEKGERRRGFDRSKTAGEAFTGVDVCATVKMKIRRNRSAKDRRRSQQQLPISKSTSSPSDDEVSEVRSQ